MNKDEIERMKRDAESHADEDKRKRELAEARNEADNKAFQLEKMLKDAGEKVTEADKAPITRAIDRVKEAAKGEDVAAIRTAIGEMDTAAQAMAQHLYKGTGADATATPSGQQKKDGGDDVIDAEYEVKK
jgi:molecular chaperone DnaK